MSAFLDQPVSRAAGSTVDVLAYDAFASQLRWPEAVRALREGHRHGRPELADMLIGPEDALLLNRAAFVRGLGYAVKAETVVPANAASGRDAVQGAVVVYDEHTGTVRGIIESKLITEFKTAADSVLGAELLARPDSGRLLVIGAGPVAQSTARAYAASFAQLKTIRVWARRPERASALVAAVEDLQLECAAVSDLEAAAGEADIIVAATSAKAPVLFGDWVSPGTHIDLIGAFTPDMREADDALMAKARVFVDYRETTVDCIGEIMQPIASGAIGREHVLGDLYELLAGEQQGRETAEDVTVFKNGGGAHLDLMTAKYVLEVALRGNAEYR
ncbi:MAG: ornithine cyclodeaminase family protein [Leucobacter sp.]